MSLLARLILLIACATLAPATVLGLHLLQERDNNINEGKHNLGALARFAAENLDHRVSGTVQLLHGLSRAPDLATSDKAACSAFLADVLAHYPQYTGLLTITPDGDLYCDSLNTGRKLNVSARSYFIESRASLQPAFDVVFGALTGIGVLQVAYPVVDGRGTLKYILLASLDLSAYAGEFVAASQYSSIQMLIWDRHGTVIVRMPDTGDAVLAGKAFPQSELFRFAASSAPRAAAELPGLDGVLTVWARGVVPESRAGGVHIVLGVPRAVLVANANQAFREALAVLLGVLLLALVAVSFIAEGGIRRPVRRLSSVAGRVGAGELSARIGAPYARGELGDLMAVFDRTADAVQVQRAEIESRSLDLQRVNRSLRMLSGINALIVRARDRQELFDEACRVAVESAGFRMAWIGIVDRATGQLSPAAYAVTGETSPDAFNDFCPLPNAGENGACVAAQAMHEKRPIVSGDSQNHASALNGNADTRARIGSSAFLPLLVGDEAVGVLALYAGEVDFFHDEELTRLTELAGNIAFAIDHIDKQERLRYLAYYDVLTGLANRSLLLERLAQYMRSAASNGHQLALVMLDLERFKSINDSLGPLAGDALLTQTARWLTRVAGDVKLLARVGPDQFVVVVPEVKQTGNLAGLVEKTAEAFLAHPFRLNEGVFRVAAKVGVAVFPVDGMSAETLFKNAEAALKKAKARGERYLFYTQQMTDTVAAKLVLENKLRQALDRGEFVLHYQPKVNLATGEVVGAEALIRWNDPGAGLVPPGQFVPLLEETGLIQEVGRWALRKAVEDYLHWRAAGLAAVAIAVNVSPLQLRNRGFVGEVAQVISVDPNAARGLELEITESLIMEDVKGSIVTVEAIRAMGVRIAIDDFGTGFSSLSHLAKLPVDTLKIDRSFVTDMSAGPEGQVLVSTIINLAHSLKLNVVAEGVETEEQSGLLRLLHCDEMQGFLFSKAVPRDVFERRFLTDVHPVADEKLKQPIADIPLPMLLER